MAQVLLTESRPSVAASRSTVGLRLPSWLDFRLVYALLIPLLYVALAPGSFPYDGPGHLDSNMYVGYFLHYTDHLPFLDNYYKLSRPPWVLPGFAAYRLFGPVLASYVLQIATMTFGLVCLYLLLRDVLNARTALIGVFLLGTCRWFHGIGGWNYHMGITIAYFLLTVLCLGRGATRPRSGWWYFLAGVALSCAVHTHLFMVVLIPGLVLHYVLTCRAAQRKLSLKHVAAALAGIVAITVLLGGINKATGGAWRFYRPQIDYVRSLSRGNEWFKPVLSWLPGAGFLVLPALALLTIPLTWLFAKGRLAKQDHPQTLVIAGFQVQLILATFAGCYFQFIKHQTVLDTSYQAVILLGPAILTLCGLLYALRERWSQRTMALTLALLVGPVLLAGDWIPLPVFVALIATSALLAVAGVVCLLWSHRWGAALVAGLLLLGWSQADAPHRRFGDLRRDCFLFSIEADEYTRGIDPSLVDIKYWYDTKEQVETRCGPIPTYSLFDNFVSVRGWCGNLFGGAPVPAIDKIQTKHLGDFGRIAILSTTTNKEDYCRQITARFAELGASLHLETERDFQHGELAFSIVVYRIDKPARAGGQGPACDSPSG